MGLTAFNRARRAAEEAQAYEAEPVQEQRAEEAQAYEAPPKRGRKPASDTEPEGLA